MSCHGTYLSSGHHHDSCASDFGAPASGDSRFVRDDQARLRAAQQAPVLRPYECYCLRTKPLCGQKPNRKYLCVGPPIPCRPEILPVKIIDCAKDSCRPCDGLWENFLVNFEVNEELNAGNSPRETWAELQTLLESEQVLVGNLQVAFVDSILFWSNAEGQFVNPADCEDVNNRQITIYEAREQLDEQGEETIIWYYQVETVVRLRAHRGRLTCANLSSQTVAEVTLPDGSSSTTRATGGDIGGFRCGDGSLPTIEETVEENPSGEEIVIDPRFVDTFLKGDKHCCSTRRKCVYYANKLADCAPCCPVGQEDYGCCPANKFC